MKEYELKNEQLEEVSGGEDCPYCGEEMSEYFKCLSCKQVFKGTPGTVNCCPFCGSIERHFIQSFPSHSF